MTREQVKALWKRCFDDSDAFTDLYFRLRYSNNANMCIRSGEEIIAALQLLPYPMAYFGQETATAYVSGACTHPDFRRRGVMHLLLSQALARLFHQGVGICTLIPATPRLFRYYGKMGFAPVFRYREYRFDAASAPPLTASVAGRVGTADTYDEDVWQYLYAAQQERTCCVLHTAADWRVVLADLQLGGGHVYTLRSRRKPAAVAVAYPAGEGVRIGELVADTPQAATCLLQGVCRQSGVPSVQVVALPDGSEADRPLGMARIVNAKAMLRLYAATHPDAEENIALADEQLAVNTGYYRVSRGRCTFSTRHLPEHCKQLSIGELAQLFFASARPFMSLMMD